MSKRMLVLYVSTLEKEVRSKFFWFILAFTALFVVLLVQLKNWIAPEGSVVLFFACLTFWSCILAVIFAVGAIRSDGEREILKQLLAFPVSRWEYLSARLLGCFSLVFFYHLLFTVVSGMFVFEQSIPFQNQLLFCLFAIPGLLALVAKGMFFSLFFNRIISLFFIFFVRILQEWGESNVSEYYHALYWLLPHTGVWWDQAGVAIGGESYSEVNWNLELGHFCVSFALLFGALYWFFRRRDV